MELPIDLVNMIKEMACIRKSNNFTVVCRIKAPLNKVIVKEVRQWFFSRLNLIKHPSVCNEQLNILIDIHGTEQIMFFIHTSGEKNEMSSDYLLEHMEDKPEYVIGVEINAVSPEFMSKQWWNEIEGNMLKQMWIKWSGEEWDCIRDFGLKNYPKQIE